MSDVWCIRPGLVPYSAAREAQRAIAEARHAGDVPDLLLLPEHPAVYTRGRRSEPSELPMGEEWYRMQGIEICETDRGGRVTYHGPGQLVGYPIIALRAYSDGVHGYVRRLERVMIDALADWGLDAQVFLGLTGVWTAGAPPVPIGRIGPQGAPVLPGDAEIPDPSAGSPIRGPSAGGRDRWRAAGGRDPSTSPGGGEPRRNGRGLAEARKIGAIGVHVRRGITTHGFAVNVNNDLKPFDWIVPCGIEACRATSIARELGVEQDLDAFARSVAERYSSAFSRRLVFPEPAKVAERISGADQLLAPRAGAGAIAR